jgi:bacterioferritin-associated ferredoxin
MAPVFIFGEQVRSIVRSGKKEIEIPEGARISSAAADLIKENKIRVKTVAPGRMSTSPAGKNVAGDKATEKVIKTNRQNQITLPVEKNTNPDTPLDTFAEISEAELEDIVNQVLRRFKELKGGGSENTGSKMPAQASAETNAATDSDDLVICRCEEITRGEIKEAIRNGMNTLNGVKRVTRAGMGLCQGQTCQQLVARILTEEMGLSAADIDPTTARGPVRPLKLGVFANS